MTNIFEAAIEAGEIRLGEITKPMLTPQKWAAFLLCDEHDLPAYLFARQQIANQATYRPCGVYDMQVALLSTDAFQQTMAVQRRYRNVDDDLNANHFVSAILRHACALIEAGEAALPDDNQFAEVPRRDNPPKSFGSLGWKSGDRR